MHQPEDDTPPADDTPIARPTPLAGEPPVAVPSIEASEAEPAPPPDEPPPLLVDSAPTTAAPKPQPAAARPKGQTWRRIGLALLALVLFGPPLLTLVYRVVPPPITVLMIERLAQGQGLTRSWRGLDDIAPALPQAVIAAEDARFCDHHGFDFEAMREAAWHNARRPGKVRGGSTISQQTAKNVFLWPARDYLRKGLEAWFTVLEEALWGKRRILEVYLNVVEWGPGTYGAQAAARRYFAEDAADLTPAQAARLAAILPSPLKWKAVNPGRYVQRRTRRIGAAEATVRDDGLARCLRG